MKTAESLVEISRLEFITQDSHEKLLTCLQEKKVVVVRRAVDGSKIRQLVSNLVATDMEPSINHQMVDGVGNLHYKSGGITSRSAYSAVDSSYYFFPWNYDSTGICNEVDEMFAVVARLNGYDPEKLRLQIPSDGIIQRYHLICYPMGRGLISPHSDPINVTRFTSGIYVTEFGRDYDWGGFYIFSQSGEKISIDLAIRSGDLVLFAADLPHGVDAVMSRTCVPPDDLNFTGRIFLNMTIVESHHRKNRETSRAYIPNCENLKDIKPLK